MRVRLFLPPILAALGLAVIDQRAAAQFGPQRHALGLSERRELEEGRDRLRAAVERLRGQARPGAADRLPDVELYLAGLDRCLRQNLFFAARDVEAARGLVREGEARAADLAAGRTPWDAKTGDVVLGYRSALDGSVQPYHLLVPEGLDRSRPGRLDLYLHGRGGTLSEVNFISSAAWSAAAYGGDRLPHLVLYPYGRGNNGWRWGGERDLFEALADVQRRFRVDPDRIYLRGFSMGGHGTWHVGLQHPDRWAAMGPGAGFTDTLVYQKITGPMPDWQRALLRLYDPIDYAANAANLPVFAYCGDQDPAIGQHQRMIAAMRAENVPFREYIGPETPHRWEPKTRAAILDEMGRHRRRPDTSEVRFVTYTLRFPRCRWVRIEGMERHWERAEVHARIAGSGEVEVTTRNVAALALASPQGEPPPAAVRLDGQLLRPAVKPRGETRFLRREGRWEQGEPAGLRKKPGLQGPIDDALFGPVLAVRGTGQAWSAAHEKWTGLELQRFREGWDEYLRAALPERADVDVTPEDAAARNLYLFGDPGSNAVLRRLLPRLPLEWTRERIALGGRSFPAAGHLPVLVFPNPEHPERYVVVNSGFTFSRADWNGSNARQYPHLPDYAVLRIDPDRFTDSRAEDVALAGFFDERWRLPAAAPRGGAVSR